MSRPSPIVVVLGFVAAGLFAIGGAGRMSQPGAGVDAKLAARLADLRPENPEAYFLLAEEVADVAVDADEIKLASSLYALAFELDRQPGRAGELAASAVLGLAAIERLDRDKRWLISLAGAIDRRYGMPDWNVGVSASITDELAYDAATVLGQARAGEGRDARRLMDKPGVTETLRRYERLIGSTGETGALSRLDKYMQGWPCPECGNSRTVTKMSERGPELRLCGTCGGNPGPKLSEEEMIAQLRFEAVLLNGIQRSWSAQMVVDLGATLRDPDPEELGKSYGVEASRPYWRGGRWVGADGK